MCYAAFLAEYDHDKNSLKKCDDAGLTKDDRKNLERLCNQGWRVAVEGSCGPEDIRFVGITYEGICLYAVDGEYEVGDRIRFRYEDRCCDI